MSRLRLRVEGGEITFRTFVRIMRGSLDILSRVDVAVTQEAHGTVEWMVRSLHSESPLTADLETRVKDPRFESAPQLVTGNVIHGFREIEREAVVPPYFSEFTLTRVKSIAKNLKQDEATRLRVINLDRQDEASLSPIAGANVTKALTPATKGIGSVTGTLEVLSRRRGYHVNIYDARTHRAVKCSFSEHDLDRVKEAFGTRVMAKGIVHRNRQGDAVRMETSEIVPLLDEEKLPTARQLQGLVPDFTGDMTTEEYVRHLRDG